MAKSGPKLQCTVCRDIIQSHHVHDYKHCKCGAVMIDGGAEYTRYGGEPWQMRWIRSGIRPLSSRPQAYWDMYWQGVFRGLSAMESFLRREAFVDSEECAEVPGKVWDFYMGKKDEYKEDRQKRLQEVGPREGKA